MQPVPQKGFRSQITTNVPGILGSPVSSASNKTPPETFSFRRCFFWDILCDVNVLDVQQLTNRLTFRQVCLVAVPTPVLAGYWLRAARFQVGWRCR